MTMNDTFRESFEKKWGSDPGESWEHWARRISAGVSDAEAPEHLAEFLYMDLAAVAMPSAGAMRKELFSFYCAASSEFFDAQNFASCVDMLDAAFTLSGKDVIWLRTGCAAVRDELKRRNVAPPGVTPYR